MINLKIDLNIQIGNGNGQSKNLKYDPKFCEARSRLNTCLCVHECKDRQKKRKNGYLLYE